MSSVADRKYIQETILPELMKDFEQYAVEYQQERDLGIKGEFVSLYRKARKLKTLLWDNNSDRSWREPLRTIIKEVACHALLMLVDHDNDPKIRFEANRAQDGEDEDEI
jgi:hypothetical protein